MNDRKPSKIFISHSNHDKAIADFIAARLRESNMAPWVDTQQILAGDDILAQIGDGLATMDLLILIVSQQSLQSQWVQRELAYASTREVEKKEALILPFIVDDTAIADLPWHIASRNARRITPDLAGAANVADSVKEVLNRRSSKREPEIAKRNFASDPQVESYIKDVTLGDWPSAERAAIEILKETDANGRNVIFEKLLDYQDIGDDEDALWAALPTIESCVNLAPWLFDRPQLNRMTTHRNFSVRATAASICHNWALDFPSLVPIDLLLRLSVPNEDWYVEAPAVAALKTLIRSVPAVLRIFFVRLRSQNPDERLRAAQALEDIADKEPELLDAEELGKHFEELKRSGDLDVTKYLRKSIKKVQSVKRISRYKYGI
jgi:hypothetical protein